MIRQRVNNGIVWDEAYEECEIDDVKYVIGENVLIGAKPHKIIHIIFNTECNTIYFGMAPYWTTDEIRSRFKDNHTEIDSILRQYHVKNEHLILEKIINWYPIRDITMYKTGVTSNKDDSNASNDNDQFCGYEWDLKINHTLTKLNDEYECKLHDIIWYYDGLKTKWQKSKILAVFSNDIYLKGIDDPAFGGLKQKKRALIRTSSWPIIQKNDRKRKLNEIINTNDNDMEYDWDENENKPPTKKQKIASDTMENDLGHQYSDNLCIMSMSVSSDNSLLKLKIRENFFFTFYADLCLKNEVIITFEEITKAIYKEEWDEPVNKGLEQSDHLLLLHKAIIKCLEKQNKELEQMVDSIEQETERMATEIGKLINLTKHMKQ